MALTDDLVKSDLAKGLAIGVGAALLTPVVLPALATIARPAARAAIKAGIIVYEKSREALAEVGEVLDDLVAEARAELEQSAEFDVEEAADTASEAAAEVTKPER